MPTPHSALRELVELKLGEDVCAWVGRRRKEDPALGWRTLANELEDITGRHIAFASLANWCRQLQNDD